MTPHQNWSGARRTTFALLTALGTLAGASIAGAGQAAAAETWTTVAAGVTYRQYDVPATAGVTHAHVLNVDLTNSHVRVGLLYPGKVASRAAVSALANGQSAVGGINGDFFNISETQHPGVSPTYSSVGPAVADGKVLKSAVPNGQRFGPKMPPGTDTRAVVGVGTDGRARLDTLSLTGTVTRSTQRLALGGLNQYALPVGSVGAFTSDWGTASRRRATCGTDAKRADPCSSETYEVTVKDDRVVAVSTTPGSGAIAADTTVLVGREAGAESLEQFKLGDTVTVRQGLASGSGTAFGFAVGGSPVGAAGRPLAGLNQTATTVRTAVGIGDGGRRVFLLALDGGSAYRKGMTVAELAAALQSLGATEGFSLDGGGSSTLVARPSGSTRVTVRNHPSDGTERLVSNGVGVFSQ
ncbi:phosphodiester glycosidase family protein [Streptomyces sp. NPDC002920]